MADASDVVDAVKKIVDNLIQMVVEEAGKGLVDIRISVPDLSQVAGVGQRVMDEWRTHAPELASMEHTSITGRMPEDSGTLIFSTTQEVNPDKNTLVRIFTDPDTQIEGPWHRIYAQYQEGPPLGHSTYTNDPHRMFMDVWTDDTPAIRSWAEIYAEKAAADSVAAANAGA